MGVSQLLTVTCRPRWAPQSTFLLNVIMAALAPCITEIPLPHSGNAEPAAPAARTKVRFVLPNAIGLVPDI